MRTISIYFIASLMPIVPAMAVDFPNKPQPLSNHGLIQNVQDYSSNPFWSQTAPYNQRMPVAVYAKGADLTAAECQSVVASLVAAECAGRNNCVGVQLSDIRPAVITQMSKLPGYNYVSACAGFLDRAFTDYVAQYGTAVGGTTNFPTALTPGNNANQPDFKIANPYAPKLPSWNGEPWLGNMIERTTELETLQAQTGGGAPKLVATQMPKTIADLTFEERMELAKAGYEEWAPVYGKNNKGERVCIKNCAYQSLSIEDDEKYWQRESAKAQQRQQMAAGSQQNAMGQTAVQASGESAADKQKSLDSIIKRLEEAIPK